MFIDFIIDRFKNNLDSEAVIWNETRYTYNNLLEKYNYWLDFLQKNTKKGAVVGVRADYNPDSIGLMLALIENANIFVPFSFANKDIDEKIESAEVEHYIKFKKEGGYDFIYTGTRQFMN